MLFKKKETDNKVAKVKDKKSDKKKTKESLALPKINPEVLRLFFKEMDEKSGIMRIDIHTIVFVTNIVIYLSQRQAQKFKNQYSLNMLIFLIHIV